MAASNRTLETIDIKKTPEELWITAKYLLGLHSNLTGENIRLRRITDEKVEKAKLKGWLIERVPIESRVPLRLIFEQQSNGGPTVFKQMIDFIKARCVVRDDEFLTIRASDLLSMFSGATGIELHAGTAFPRLMKNVMILYPAIRKKATAKGVVYVGIALNPVDPANDQAQVGPSTGTLRPEDEK
jgi:hypothetical protein